MNFVVRVVILVLALPQVARAIGPVQRCVDASEAGQQAQRAGQLLQARTSFERCALAECPGLVAGECTRWLDEVIRATPSLVLIVRLDNIDQLRARVLLDGHLWLEELTGRPVDLEPGSHRLTVQLDGRVQEQTLLVNVGEKNRPVTFRYESPIITPEEVAPAHVPEAAAGPSFALPWTVTGVALAGWGAFATLGLLGRTQLDALVKGPCGVAKTCPPSQVAGIRAVFLAADVSLGIAGVATIVAGLLWWRGLAAPVLSVAPMAGGVSFSLTGTW